MKTFVRIVSILLVLVLAFSLASCKKEEQSVKESSTDAEALDKDIDAALKLLGKSEEWPKDKLPQSFPQQPAGKIINAGSTGDEVIIKMEEVPQDAFDEFKAQLESNGWKMSDNVNASIKATYELYELSADYSDDGSLQLWLIKQQELAWPDKLLPSGFPKFEKGKVSDVNDDTDNNIVGIYIEGASIADAVEYLDKLIQSGWEGEKPEIAEGQNSFNTQLSKDGSMIDYDFYENADAFCIQVVKQ